MYLSSLREDLEKLKNKIFTPKIMFYAYSGSSIVCSFSANVAFQKAWRSKIPLNKAKYAGTCAAMALASEACRVQAFNKKEESLNNS